ncbi:hypothetical protein [Streptomyces sp. UNOC14_S4]|uniref:hypothetical protein n=1 Tax=Streptomyces sp. UNOC14_S4 TaxID=2872340 RepID=UPI001E4ED425|nr:hypothetical protein [Streptomyces sp. UNOC14_S4]MCC3766476.1 hypothetical protein [Streptomyces sp. UNOC14_S4]
MTDIYETSEQRAGRLGMEIWLSLLPHVDQPVPLERRSAEDAPAAEYRLTEVTDTAQLRSGDLIVLYNPIHKRESQRIIGRGSAREAVQVRNSAVCRVESVSPKTIRVHRFIHIPLGGWGSCDPDKVGLPKDYDEHIRVAIGSQQKMIARLGHVDDFVAGFKAHPEFSAWRDAYVAVMTEQDVVRAANRARMEERDRRRQPLLDAADGLNSILGDRVVGLESFGLGLDEIGNVEFPVKWFGEGNRLVIYLAGLHAVGEIDASVYAEGIGYLRALGLCDADASGDGIHEAEGA